MKKSATTRSSKKLDTAINVIGGIRDINVIFETIKLYSENVMSNNNMHRQKHLLSIRTENSRTRIGNEIEKIFMTFSNKDHEELFVRATTIAAPFHDKALFLVWQMALNNELFREITTHVFAKTYYSGRATISKDDVTAYLKEFLLREASPEISWSEITIKTLSTKYLNLMSKLGFLCSGRTKSFKHIRPSSEAQVLFLYFAKLVTPDSSNILSNELLPISFVPNADAFVRH